MPSEVRRRQPCEVKHACLGRAICCCSKPCAVPGDTGCVDDGCPFSTFHMRRGITNTHGDRAEDEVHGADMLVDGGITLGERRSWDPETPSPFAGLMAELANKSASPR
jgi:hypothetical protein